MKMKMKMKMEMKMKMGMKLEEEFGDARSWDDASYSAFLRAQRVASTRTVFAARFGPPSAAAPHHHHHHHGHDHDGDGDDDNDNDDDGDDNDDGDEEELLAVASSDGSVSLYTLPHPCRRLGSFHHHHHQPLNADNEESRQVLDPSMVLASHKGAAYDLQFYGEGSDAILFSCGDDGRIQGWHWEHIKDGALTSNKDVLWEPDILLTNPQQKGPRGSLAPIPETNAIAPNAQDGHIYSATGSGLAYCWDIEREKIITTFEGHSEYLHCICSQPSQKQVITGSEDGTARVWDCRNASCIAVLDPCKAARVSKTPKEKLSWVSCVAVDSSEKWLVSGTGGNCLTLWSLLSFDAVTRILTPSTPQAVTIANDQIMAVGSHPHLTSFTYGGDVISQVNVAPSSAFSLSVYSTGVSVIGGYGGIVDIISEFGSHMYTFKCK